MLRLLATACLAAVLAAPMALAQDWLVDPEASSVTFEATAFNSPVTGEFADFGAEIRLDPDDLSDARIDAVVRTGSARMSNDNYQAAVTGAGGLNPGDHPAARFLSTDVTRSGDGYEARGDLTINGRTREVALPFTLDITGSRAVAEGAFAIDRGDFGVGGPDWSDVDQQVTIRLHIEAEAAD
ncbi:polyisoprenoid-binding protein [Marinicauda salina]|uniref:Polyisoprenoid-binding protein n=1 Tax=Marinicauda salina TaxID=2135793 RepID=A0A2U2BUD0_9PROT|nr:YceI family protein [Marinicauda salina]PWE17597.1 polyisoprenoid-binding protein [Marinicauda salina]